MKKLITLFTILTLVLAVPVPTTAAEKTDSRPVITTTNKSVKITKVKSGKYKTTLNTGTKRIALKAKVSGKNVTKKCKWKSSNKKVATITKTGKLTVKKAGKTNITLTYKDKKTVLKVTVKAKEPAQDEEDEEPACKHDWEAHWVTESAEGIHVWEELSAQGYSMISACRCLRVFYSFEEKREHKNEVLTRQAIRNAFLDDPVQKLCGKHSDNSEYTCVDTGSTPEVVRCLRTIKYVDYFTCKICGKKINEEGFMN